jgi:hypothetical protein
MASVGGYFSCHRPFHNTGIIKHLSNFFRFRVKRERPDFPCLSLSSMSDQVRGEP